MNPELLTKFLC